MKLKIKLFTSLLTSYSLMSKLIGQRGLHRFSMLLGNLFFSREDTIIHPIANNLNYKFHLKDPYWNKLLIPNYRYEPELHHLFARLTDVDYSFIDCGANLGYWSVLVAGSQYGPKPTTTIEPVAYNHQVVSENLSINKLDHVTLHQRAISKQSGEIVKMVFVENDFSNTAASISESSGGSQYEEVTTMTLHELIVAQSNKQIVVKLDIEGQEIPALESAADVIQNPHYDILFSYEDHGNDKSSNVTQYLLDQGYQVVFLSDDNNLTQINSAKQASAIKTNIHRGYNFVAFRSDSNLKLHS